MYHWKSTFNYQNVILYPVFLCPRVSCFLSFPILLLNPCLLIVSPFFCWQREYDENEVDPYHGQQEKEPEVEPLDLPDNLNLESNEKSDDEEDEGTAENLYRFLEGSRIEVGGTIRSWALFAYRKERDGGRILCNHQEAADSFVHQNTNIPNAGQTRSQNYIFLYLLFVHTVEHAFSCYPSDTA